MTITICLYDDSYSNPSKIYISDQIFIIHLSTGQIPLNDYFLYEISCHQALEILIYNRQFVINCSLIRGVIPMRYVYIRTNQPLIKTVN